MTLKTRLLLLNTSTRAITAINFQQAILEERKLK